MFERLREWAIQRVVLFAARLSGLQRPRNAALVLGMGDQVYIYFVGDQPENAELLLHNAGQMTNIIVGAEQTVQQAVELLETTR